MAWPDATEAEAYIGEITADQVDIMEDCLAAAISYLEWRTDGALEVEDEDDDPLVYIVPDSLREAALLLTSRLFRRRLSPEGVAGFGDFGAVRVTTLDPDIEALVTPSRSWGIA